MLKLRDGIVELYRKVATSIPKDVEEALRSALSRETGPSMKDALSGMIRSISTARTTSCRLCEDTGFPVFFVKVPKGLSHRHVEEVIVEATRIATRKVPLSANAVDIITGENTGDNVGDHFPLIYTDESEESSLVVDLMLRGGDCESLGRTYALPALLTTGQGEQVLADRNFEGVQACVLDAVAAACGKACPPFVLGVAIGGARDQVALLSKRQLLRRLTDIHPNALVAEAEKSIFDALNGLGGASGFDGQTIALGVKISTAHRHPLSYLVDISFSCWTHRRGRLIW
ncbi:MAG TPA: fumarate hydratase [Dissulfurispiraceae bacterium]|nr:fumarate hydratase [Dissulfurispiraceae bacterium]